MKVATQRISFDNGKTMTARWLAMGTDELFLQKDAAILLNVTPSTISESIKTHKLLSFGLTEEQKEFLTTRNIISKKDRHSRLLPRDTMDALVKIVNTKEAWAIWAQILNAVRNPTANIELQQEIGGLDRVREVADAAFAVMSVSIDKQADIAQMIEDKLTANGIAVSNAVFIGDKFYNGTTNQYYKHLNQVFAPRMHERLKGNEFFTRVLHAENYNQVVEYITGSELSPELRKALKSVQFKRESLLMPAIKGAKVKTSKASER